LLFITQLAIFELSKQTPSLHRTEKHLNIVMRTSLVGCARSRHWREERDNVDTVCSITSPFKPCN